MMIDTVITFLSDLTNISGRFGQIFYWSPLLINLIGYSVFTWKRVQDDRRAVEDNEKYYSSFITVGSVVSYVLYTLLPVINCLMLVFHIGPKILEWIGVNFEWIFSLKLVKDTRNKEKAQ